MSRMDPMSKRWIIFGVLLLALATYHAVSGDHWVSNVSAAAFAAMGIVSVTIGWITRHDPR